MKITKPSDTTSGTSLLEEAVSMFEKEFSKKQKDESYYFLIVHKEFNRETCNAIENIYKDAGWVNVTCKTSSENGERGGLTGLQLYKSK